MRIGGKRRRKEAGERKERHRQEERRKEIKKYKKEGTQEAKLQAEGKLISESPFAQGS